MSTRIPDPAGDLGLRDPDQPTLQAHEAYIAERTAEFTPHERWMLRLNAGLLPAEDQP